MKTLVIAAVAAVLFTLAVIVPSWSALGLVAVLAWFAVPGVVLARRLYGGQTGGWAAALLAGPGWGYVLSSLVLLGLWVAGVRSVFWLALAPVPASIAVLPARKLASSLVVPSFNRRDAAAYAAVVLAVVAIVGRPYSQVGVDVPDGRAYRAYFTADFVWAMAVVSEVSKGDVPPRNPYYLDDSLHYYWLMHLLPAVEHRAAPAAFSVEQLLLVNALWTALAFAGFFYFLVRHFVDRPWPAALACIGVLFCSSFEGIDRLLWIREHRGSLDELRVLNIDAIGNWIYHGMKIDGLHRLLLYQPQHQLSYLLGFSALLLPVQAPDASRPGLLFLAGVFLAMALLWSSFVAVIFAAMAAVYETVRLVQARRWRAFVPCAATAAVPLTLALAMVALLQYVDRAPGGNPLLALGLNPLAANRVALTIFLNAGPVVMVALVGVAAAIWRRALARFVPLFIVLATSALFYFFVDVPDHQNVYVGLHVGKLVFIALTPLCGFALQECWARGRVVRWSMSAGAALVAIAALPTVLIDLYNTQDVSNRAMGPGFRWTVVLSPAEMKGLDWIKRETPPVARVQVEPYVRDRDAYYVTAFAERRTAGGLPTGMIPLAKYEEVSARIRTEVYQSSSARDAHDRALGLCIDYLVVGQPERTAYPTLQPLLDESPFLFQPAFRNDALAIYAVSGSWERPECPH